MVGHFPVDLVLCIVTENLIVAKIERYKRHEWYQQEALLIALAKKEKMCFIKNNQIEDTIDDFHRHIRLMNYFICNQL